MKKLPEVWQRGPVQNIPPLLQPIAHALLQAYEEIEAVMHNFPDEMLFDKVAGLASPAFHLQHMAGVTDRLFTYARGEMLTDEQLAYLSVEGKVPILPYTSLQLVQAFGRAVQAALRQLEATPGHTLTQTRGVGRRQIPSTVIGLYVHAAEHAMRHLGQLLVTVSVLKAGLK